MEDKCIFNQILEDEFDGKTSKRLVSFDLFEEQVAYLMSYTKRVRPTRWPQLSERDLVGVFRSSFTIRNRSIRLIKIWKHKERETFYFEVHKYDKDGTPVVKFYRWLGSTFPTV